MHIFTEKYEKAEVIQAYDTHPQTLHGHT